MKDIGLPSVELDDLEKLDLETLTYFDNGKNDVFEVHFLGIKSSRNICWVYNPNYSKTTAVGCYEQQTFDWIMKMVSEGKFVILEGEVQDIAAQVYKKDISTSLQNKNAPRPA